MRRSLAQKEELRLKQEELRQMAEPLKMEIKNIKITRNARQAILERVDSIVEA